MDMNAQKQSRFMRGTDIWEHTSIRDKLVQGINT